MIVDPEKYKKYIIPKWKNDFILFCYDTSYGLHYELVSKKYDWEYAFDVPKTAECNMIAWFMTEAMEQFKMFWDNLSNLNDKRR